MEKEGLKRMKREDIATREEEGRMKAHKGGDSASVSIEILELPSIPWKKQKLNPKFEWICASLEALQNYF